MCSVINKPQPVRLQSMRVKNDQDGQSHSVFFQSPACEDVKEAIEEKTEEVTDKQVAPPKSASVRKEVTEEDLEDWLDSMIS